MPWLGPVRVTQSTLAPVVEIAAFAPAVAAPNEPPLAVVVPAHRVQPIAREVSSVIVAPTVKLSTSTNVAVDAAFFVPSTSTVIVCAPVVSPENVFATPVVRFVV